MLIAWVLSGLFADLLTNLTLGKGAVKEDVALVVLGPISLVIWIIRWGINIWREDR